jgi:hypothetical protein
LSTPWHHEPFPFMPPDSQSSQGSPTHRHRTLSIKGLHMPRLSCGVILQAIYDPPLAPAGMSGDPSATVGRTFRRSTDGLGKTVKVRGLSHDVGKGGGKGGRGRNDPRRDIVVRRLSTLMRRGLWNRLPCGVRTPEMPRVPSKDDHACFVCSHGPRCPYSATQRSWRPTRRASRGSSGWRSGGSDP